MNMTAKIHADVPSRSKLQFFPASENEPFTSNQFCLQLCVENQYKQKTSVAYLTNFSIEFILGGLHKRLLSTFSISWCKKWKMTKKWIQGVGF